MDPLHQYERYTYDQYDAIQQVAYNQKLPFLHNVAPNLFGDLNNIYNINNMAPPTETREPDDNPVEHDENIIHPECNLDEEIDSKEHLKPLMLEVEKQLKQKNQSKTKTKVKTKAIRNKNRPRGRTSSYWNKKITDKDFKFYGCTICNIAYATLDELDKHVTIHKGRVTSYDIKQKNLKRKKMLKKLAKKAKKLGEKIKQEGVVVVEIKPEDGYIGTEIASSFQDGVPENFGSIPPAQPSENGRTIEKNGVIPENNTENPSNVVNNLDKKSTDAQTTANPAEIAPNTSENGNETSAIRQEIIKYASQIVSTTDNAQQKAHKVPIEQQPPINGAAKPPGQLTGPEIPNDPRLQVLFKCFGCEKQFALSYYLKLHVRSHTGEKPYTCAACGESFITASKMGRHNKRVHLSAKCTCRICFRQFGRFENLVKHFDRKHPDDKLEGEPYDYNTILPYIKELEDQMIQKKEMDDVEKKKIELEADFMVPPPSVSRVKDEQKPEKKPKAEDLWDDNWGAVEQLHQTINQEQEDKKPYSTSFLDMDLVKQEPDEYDNDPDRSSPIDIVIEAMKYQDQPVKMEHSPDDRKVDRKPIKQDERESMSDEDYFPENTWALEPKPDLDAAPAECTTTGAKRKKLYKRSDYPLKCDQCDKQITTPGYMKVHMRTHTGERPFKCYVCDRGFITSSKMHRHVLTHQVWSEEDEKPLKPGEAVDVKIKTEDSGTTVERPKKKGTRKRGKVPITKELLEKKKEYTAKKRHHTCKFCSKKFLHKETLVEHHKTHAGEPIVYKCNFCLEVQPDEEMLKIHESTHQGPKPYLCTDCGRYYTKRESMVYHKKSHHDPNKESKKSFICDICSKAFNAQCKLQKHLVSHNIEKFVLRYECPVCAHMFNTKWHIQMHLQTHQKEGLISEDNRSEILAMVQQNARKIPLKPEFSTLQQTSQFTDLIPSDDRSRVCNICGQVFQHFYYLEEHLKSHGSKIALTENEEESERKHICPVCNKGFKLGYYLKLHSYTHTKEKPYICQTCGKGFITKGKLKRHLETHSGLKKYQCHVCYKFFTRPGYLRIHVRTIHGHQDYNFKYTHQPPQDYM